MVKRFIFALAVMTAVSLTLMGASCQPPVGGCPETCPPGTHCDGTNCVPDAQPEPTGPKFIELLLRTDGVKLIRPNQTAPFVPFGAVQCCMGHSKIENSRWPLASESWMDYTKANMFHFRMGPFFGDASHESEWADIGGPYGGCEDGSTTYGCKRVFHPPFWEKVVALTEHAGKRGANVEVNVEDTWYCKRASTKQGFKDQEMPWPQADIDACGIEGSPEQERFIRKVVSTLNDYANVIWITDNEGGEIRGAKRGWYEWVAQIIRDEEQKGQYKIVRLIGTNNTDFADGPFDYVATHARAALNSPIAGKHTENNERNPEFDREQEFANYCKAQDAGLHYWFWRAGMSEADADWLLEKMQKGCRGVPIGCFPPASDDPLWVEPPAGGAVGTSMRSALEASKVNVGSRCNAVAGDPPTIHMGAIETLDLLASDLRQRGYCAGRMDDSVFIQAPEGKWQEFHAVAFSTGCYAADPAQLPKNTWTYGGATTPPPGGGENCANPDPLPVSKWNVKEHTKGPNWTTIDSTPLVCDRNYCAQVGFTDGRSCCSVRQEGDPLREECEARVVGTPVWSGLPGGRVRDDNPYQYLVPRETEGALTVCTSVQPAVCGTIQVTK